MDLGEIFYQPEEVEEEKEHQFVDAMGFHIRLPNAHHSLWGELLWPAGKIVSRCIKERSHGFSVDGKTVIEFGAGCGLCSLVAATNGAKRVVCTDYPDDLLIDNLKFNCNDQKNIIVLGYKWGCDASEVIKENDNEKFDTAILTDLVFNVACHRQLLKSLKECLKPDGFAMVSYTQHRALKAEQDAEFFNIADKEFGFNVEELFTEKHDPMFAVDQGDIERRTTCHVFRFTFKDTNQ